MDFDKEIKLNFYLGRRRVDRTTGNYYYNCHDFSQYLSVSFFDKVLLSRGDATWKQKQLHKGGICVSNLIKFDPQI